MKIVIDINEHIYKQIMADSEVYILDNEVDRILIENAIYNGTPLPKEHGDLIDRDSLELDSDWSDYYDGFSAYSESQVRLAPTIIEGSETNV